MLNQLEETLKILPELLHDPDRWDSLIVNKRKPYTYRVSTKLDNGLRVCLHKFDKCSDHEAFKHPHPWPGAFIILHGGYRMWLGQSKYTGNDPQDVASLELSKYSKYEIVEPSTWHNVIPLETTYTVMVNGEPWASDVVHPRAPATKGKDLDKMPREELLEHLFIFEALTNSHNKRTVSELSITYLMDGTRALSVTRNMI